MIRSQSAPPTRAAYLLHSSSAMAKTDGLTSQASSIFVHSTRTAVAAIVSLLIAELFRMQEPFWAPITTLVIAQSSLGAAWAVSRQRLIGTVLGAALGALAATYFEPSSSPALHLVVFGICVFLLGVICELSRLDIVAYRFGGITLIVVLIVPLHGAAWLIALHRFAAVSIGILVALGLATVWPEREPG